MNEIMQMNNLKRQNNFYGYRGTTKYWAQQLEKHRRFSISDGDDEYFGHGIYFFENDYHEAYNFAKYARGIEKSNISVIYAHIETDNVLDLTLTKTYEAYIKLIDVITSKYEDEEEKPILKKPFDCKILNDICNREGHLLVRGSYNPRHKKGISLFEKGYTRVIKTHIQLCVKDQSIIKECKICC